MSCDSVVVSADGVALGASLEVPSAARGLVLFCHGSGRHSPRNRYVARALAAHGFATLLVDLLTPDETQRIGADAGLGFDVEFLADRLVGVTDWARRDARTAGLEPCYFGAGTAAAVAVIAAARGATEIRAIVSRAGKLDLAASFLAEVRAPTLLIVGAEDAETLARSRSMLDRIPAVHRLAMVAGATHLFSEPGALDEVAHLTTGWLCEHVPAASAARVDVPTARITRNQAR